MKTPKTSKTSLKKNGSSKNETVYIIGEYFLRNLICAKYFKNSCYRYNYLFDIKGIKYIVNGCKIT